MAYRRGTSLNRLCSSLLQLGLSRAGAPAEAERVPGGPDNAWLPDEALAKIKATWGRQLFGVLVFGSAARGEAGPSSDLDALLVLSPTASINRSLYDTWAQSVEDVEMERRRVSPHFVALPPDPFEAGGLWYEVAIDGIVVWEREGRPVSAFLRAVRETIAAGLVVRETLDGHPYWVKHVEEKP